MNQHADLTKQHRAWLFALLGLTVFPPISFLVANGAPWLPAWLGAATALVWLFGALTVLWRAGAMRLRFLALFAAAVVLVAAYGSLARR